MDSLWIAVIIAALTHPITFMRGLFPRWRSEPRSERIKNQNRDALAALFGMKREELDELLEEMSNER